MLKTEKPKRDKPASAHTTRPVHKHAWWFWIETLLLAVGMAALAAFGAARIDSYLGARAATREFATLSSPSSAASRGVEEAHETAAEPDSANVHLDGWDEHRQQEYLRNAAASSGKPIAVLRIPKIHLEVPVLEGTDDRTLNRGAGRIAGTARPGDPGNIGIAAHRDGFFRGLKDVHVGDTIELATLKGNHSYAVDRIQIVTPDNVKVLAPRTTPSLTLVTCYPFYFIGEAPQRYIVSASQVPDAQKDSGRITAANARTTANRP
jgi:sortase A